MDLANHEYKLIIKDDSNNPVFGEPIPIPVSVFSGRAFIYTCDKDGLPKNTFILNNEDVYLKGENVETIIKDKNNLLHVKSITIKLDPKKANADLLESIKKCLKFYEFSCNKNSVKCQ